MPEDRAPLNTHVDDFIAPVCHELVTILYQDADILLINKPSGLLSLSGKHPLNWDSVHYRLVNGQAGVTPAFPTAKLPHRLDLGTSGIMIVGLNELSSKHLNRQFQSRTIKKRYIAMLEGWLAHDQGEVTASIAKDKTLFPKVKICELTGKSAKSAYTVLARTEVKTALGLSRRSLVQFTPHTGRTHQLRIHSYYMGHAILGCDLYKSAHSEHLADRLNLHACDLYFEHPTQGNRLHGHCPCPF